MPPKGKSKALAKKNSFIGQYSSSSKTINNIDKKLSEQKEIIKRKEQELEDALENNTKLSSEITKLKNESEQYSVDIYELRKEIQTKQHKLVRNKIKLSELSSNVSIKKDEIRLKKRVANCHISISQNTAKRRKLHPTSEILPIKAKSIRCNETLELCMAIHGASSLNNTPALCGLVQTITSKFNSKEVVNSIMSSKASVVNSIKDTNVKEWMNSFYLSEENLIRSLNTYYSHDVLGKAKYINIRKANKKSNFDKINLVNFVPYKKVAERISNIDIGKLIDVNPIFTENYSIDNETKQGMFRPLDQYACRLAKHYFYVNEFRTDKMKTFTCFKKIDQESFMFLMSIGGDGAPLVGCTFLLSFLNSGKRITSSNENFLIFGGNVEENSTVVRRYVLKLLSDIKFLENQVFEIQNAHGVLVKTEFRLAELPNDMKMIAFLAGELSNASYYFSTFGNVNQEDASDFSKKFDNTDKGWKEFSYDKRVSDSLKVADKKKSLLNSKLAAKTKRSQITSYISKTLNSRQEELPLVECYIKRAKSEPLHLKNNTVKELFMKLLKISFTESKLVNIKSFDEITEEKPLFKFIKFIRYEISCNFLGKKVIQWFNENGGKVDKPFTFRFRGKESRAYLNNFHRLILSMFEYTKSEPLLYRLHQIFFMSICLRKIISYSVRIENFDATCLKQLKISCKKLFITSCIFDKKISPSLWTLCNAVPFHSIKTFEDYNFGLGCNSMEGREQKHQRIAKYANNTTYKCRWPLIFRHEFVQLVYLKENGFDQVNYNRKNISYMPVIKENCCNSCGLEYLDDLKCSVCDSIYMKRIDDLLVKHL